MAKIEKDENARMLVRVMRLLKFSHIASGSIK